ncbi:MAG TPA: hypothetical protein PK691_01805, partial [Thermomicrobiales bacterium]|nr:hypothetical protein [Thermomicrobiales bacterium]
AGRVPRYILEIGDWLMDWHAAWQIIVGAGIDTAGKAFGLLIATWLALAVVIGTAVLANRILEVVT